MNKKISGDLSRNGDTFKALLTGLPVEQYLWKPQPDKWCLLEIVCHLHDEERNDFRARAKHVLETPSEPMPSIDPKGWVKARKYLEQDYAGTLDKFLEERKQSTNWLESITDPQWDNVYHHEALGEMTAQLFLSNWVAHDYLHIRQILELKFHFLKQETGEDLLYAGDW